MSPAQPATANTGKPETSFPKLQRDRTTAKFIQIASGQPYGQGLTIFALDEDGGVWQIIPGREPEQWVRLPQKRAGGPGRPASR